MTYHDISPVLLYVEDEQLVQKMMTDVLESAGFKLIVCSSGEEALDLLMADNNHIAGLVTDINLGRGPTGWNVARRARMLIARIPVIYASSVSENDWMVNGVPLSRLVAKPFRPSRIVDMISTMVAASRHAESQMHHAMRDSASGPANEMRSTLLARRAAVARISQSHSARYANLGGE